MVIGKSRWDGPTLGGTGAASKLINGYRAALWPRQRVTARGDVHDDAEQHERRDQE